MVKLTMTRRARAKPLTRQNVYPEWDSNLNCLREWSGTEVSGFRENAADRRRLGESLCVEMNGRYRSL